MGLIRRQPRKFNRVNIYSDERKEKLDKLVNDVKREMGELPEEEQTKVPTSFKGKFSQFTPRAQKASQGGRRLSWPIAILIILALLLAWRFILTGRV